MATWTRLTKLNYLEQVRVVLALLCLSYSLMYQVIGEAEEEQAQAVTVSKTDIIVVTTLILCLNSFVFLGSICSRSYKTKSNPNFQTAGT